MATKICLLIYALHFVHGFQAASVDEWVMYWHIWYDMTQESNVNWHTESGQLNPAHMYR